MTSKIEQIIEEIEEYIENCKPQFFNGSNIIVDKNRMEELLTELRLKAPEEIRLYQKVLSNKDAIMADTHAKAQEMLEQSIAHSNEMVQDHEIMQQARTQAQEIIVAAQQQAQEIMDNAQNDADIIRMGAINYTDDMLKNIEEILSRAMETTRARTDHLLGSLQECFSTVTANRSELVIQDTGAAQQPRIEEDMELEIPVISVSEDGEQ